MLIVGPNSSAGGKSDPKLEAARPGCFVEPAAVPHAASSLHPFDAAGRQCAPDVIRINEADRAFRDVSQSSNTRVRVERPIEGCAYMVEEVEKHEWLQDLAEVRRAHQTCYRAVRPATGALHDRRRQTRWSPISKTFHDSFLSR